MEQVLYFRILGGIVWLCIWGATVPYLFFGCQMANQIWFLRFWGNVILWIFSLVLITSVFDGVDRIVPWLFEPNSTRKLTHIGHLLTVGFISPFVPIVNNLFIPGALAWLMSSYVYWLMLLS